MNYAGSGLIITRMVINMDESRLTTIPQIEDFLSASASIEFKPEPGAADVERYAHISAVLKRFDYPGAANASAACCWPIYRLQFLACWQRWWT